MSESVLTPRPANAKEAFAAGLHLAASPAFALMALLTALGSGHPDTFCAAMTHASPLGGMVPMYLLMSVFHAAPWLKLMGGR